MRKPTLLTVVVSATLALGASCGRTPTQALLITEAGLQAIANDFVAASEVATERCNVIPRRAPDSFCNGFKAFAEKFKQAFPQAANLWITARRTRDAAVQEGAASALRALAAELSPYLLQLNELSKEKS